LIDLFADQDKVNSMRVVSSNSNINNIKDNRNSDNINNPMKKETLLVDKNSLYMEMMKMKQKGNNLHELNLDDNSTP